MKQKELFNQDIYNNLKLKKTLFSWLILKYFSSLKVKTRLKTILVKYYDG